MGARAITAALVLLLAALAGCGGPVSTPPRSASAKPAPPPSGVQRWRATCARCHGLHPPDFYDAEQWRVAMSHMRLRAYLTAEDHRAIAEFLSRR